MGAGAWPGSCASTGWLAKPARVAASRALKPLTDYMQRLFAREVLLDAQGRPLFAPRVLCVPGNHDHFFGPDIGLWQAFLQDHGVEVLMNRGRRLTFSGED